jgi:hypothetical protein
VQSSQRGLAATKIETDIFTTKDAKSTKLTHFEIRISKFEFFQLRALRGGARLFVDSATCQFRYRYSSVSSPLFSSLSRNRISMNCSGFASLAAGTVFAKSSRAFFIPAMLMYGPFSKTLPTYRS